MATKKKAPAKKTSTSTSTVKKEVKDAHEYYEIDDTLYKIVVKKD
jgi:hypothetical protein